MNLAGRLKAIWANSLAVSPYGSRLALTMLTNLALAGLSLVTGMMAARLLGPSGRGELAAIQAWPTFLAIIATLGIPEALVYYSARHPNLAGRWMATSEIAGLAACIPFAVIGYFALPFLLGAQSAGVVAAARSYLWLLPIYAVVGILPNTLRGLNDFIAWNLVRFSPILVWVLVLVYSFITSQPSASLLARWYLIGLATLFFPISYIIFRRVPGPFKPARSHIKPLLTFGVPAVLSTLPATLNVRLDQLLMAMLLDPLVLGQYAVAVGWSMAISPLITALPATLLPQVAGTPAESEQTQVLAQTVRLGALFSLILAVLFAILTPLGIPILFGRAFVPAIPAGIILSLAGGFLYMNQTLEAGVMSLGKPKLALVAEMVGLGATALLLGALLLPYQALGAAIASMVSYIVVFLVLLILLHRVTGTHLKTLLIPSHSDILMIRDKMRVLWTRFLSQPAK